METDLGAGRSGVNITLEQANSGNVEREAAFVQTETEPLADSNRRAMREIA